MYIAALCLCGLSSCQHDGGAWTARVEECAPMPEKRASAVCCVSGEKAYMAFGRDTAGTLHADMYIYTPATNRWSEPEDTPLKPRVNACACAASGKIYIGMGYDGGGYQRADSAYLNDWWCYDPTSKVWKELAHYPNRRTDRAIAFATEEAIYVGYGFQTNYTRDMFRYDIQANRWDSVDVGVGPYEYPQRSFGGTGASVNGHHYYGTGFRGKSMNWWAEFLPEGEWIKRQALPGGGVTLAAAAATGNKILLTGGHHVGGVGTDGRVEARIWCYDTEKDRWQYTGCLPEGRMNHTAFAYGEWVYVAGGDNERFCPTDKMWRIRICEK